MIEDLFRALGHVYLAVCALAAPALLVYILHYEPPRRVIFQQPPEVPVAQAQVPETAEPEQPPTQPMLAQPAPAPIAPSPPAQAVEIAHLLDDARDPKAVGAAQAAEVWAALGRAHLAAGRQEEARAAFERAVAVSPTPTSVVLDLASESPNLAAMLLPALLARGPHEPRLLQSIATVFDTQGLKDQALALLRDAVARAPDDADIIEDMIEHDADLGVGYAEAWAAAHPNSTSGTMDLAQALADAGRPDAALRLVRAAIKTAPPGGTAHLAAFLARHAPADAIAAIEPMLAESPDNVSLLRSLAMAYEATGRPMDAARALRRSFEVTPPDITGTRIVVGGGTLVVHRYGDGTAFSFDTDEDYMEDYARLDPQGAVDLFGPRAVASPDDPVISAALGLAYKALGKTEEAGKALRLAVSKVPERGDWAKAYAGVDPAGAVAFYEAQASKHDDDPEAMEVLGDVYRAVGREADAQAAYQKAWEAESDSPNQMVRIKEKMLEGR